MKAHLYTLIDLTILGIVYFGSSWLFGAEATMAEYALCVATYALLQHNRRDAA